MGTVRTGCTVAALWIHPGVTNQQGFLVPHKLEIKCGLVPKPADNHHPCPLFSSRSSNGQGPHNTYKIYQLAEGS